ncbi:hypothetical protein MTR67_034547 [Solanum verrucosum]|uniref:Reverse transcriptase/retrotransposon-derived protein RNase H-like domain-containing protein n=1 Tax=Solanum verrucosum TaxID=315347 RepID=A0AAF0ZJC7_SOLVR|nr:hypothetical protein MTR67_034547 [Solanum verrucosum]
MIASPLTALTQKKANFILPEACEKSFQEWKDRLTSAPVLTLSDGTYGFVVYCDASRIGLGYVFMQNGKVIAYASRKLKKDYDMSVLYHPSKANVVADSLSRFSMGSVAHIDDDKKKLVRDVHKLARLGVQLFDSTKDGVMVHNGSESSFVAVVKVRQGLYPILLELKEAVLKKSVEAFSQ